LNNDDVTRKGIGIAVGTGYRFQGKQYIEGRSVVAAFTIRPYRYNNSFASADRVG